MVALPLIRRLEPKLDSTQLYVRHKKTQQQKGLAAYHEPDRRLDWDCKQTQQAVNDQVWIEQDPHHGWAWLLPEQELVPQQGKQQAQ